MRNNCYLVLFYLRFLPFLLYIIYADTRTYTTYMWFFSLLFLFLIVFQLKWARYYVDVYLIWIFGCSYYSSRYLIDMNQIKTRCDKWNLRISFSLGFDFIKLIQICLNYLILFNMILPLLFSQKRFIHFLLSCKIQIKNKIKEKVRKNHNMVIILLL